VLSAYPNPFNPNQTIQLRLDKPGYVEMTIMDVRGRVVREISGKAAENGYVSMHWDGKSNALTALPSGVYFIANLDKRNPAVFKVTLLR